MGRSGAIWLVKVGAATVLLATIGVFAAPANNGDVPPTEPTAPQRHWSAAA